MRASTAIAIFSMVVSSCKTLQKTPGSQLADGLDREAPASVSGERAESILNLLREVGVENSNSGLGQETYAVTQIACARAGIAGNQSECIIIKLDTEAPRIFPDPIRSERLLDTLRAAGGQYYYDPANWAKVLDVM